MTKTSELIAAQVKAALPETIQIRRHLHMNPELTWREHQTAAFVADRLAEISSISVSKFAGGLGVVGVMKGEADGPVFGLRADMDALPIFEKTNAPHKSCVDGVMHACGHDGHVANLLGTAKVLHNLRQHIKGTVKFIFQPAEEGGAGAKKLCDEGVLDDPRVDVIFGLHGWPEEKLGRIILKDGPVLAANAKFWMEVKGRGGHGAFPHLSYDPILAAAQIVTGLQTIVSRNVSPLDPAVVTVAKIHGGTAVNVIPDSVILEGTIRSLNDDVMKLVCERFEQIASQIGVAHQATVETKITPGYPVTYNDPTASKIAREIIRGNVGEESVVEKAVPSMGSEDFSYYLQQRPGAFLLIGLQDPDYCPSLHSPLFDFNDKALEVGMNAFCNLALNSTRFVPSS
jgi:amidohydrolase